jgi:hypothetical protein
MRAAVIEGLMRYVKHGISPGSGIRAVLEGDLYSAKRSLDSYNWQCLEEIVDLVQYCLPMSAFGSKEAVKKWLELTPEAREARGSEVQYSLQMLETRLRDIRDLDAAAAAVSAN